MDIFWNNAIRFYCIHVTELVFLIEENHFEFLGW